MLRDYQQRAIDMLYAWFEDGNAGNPCLVLPTGAGKSHIIAALVKDALQNWPETRVLMLTHQKELIEQNAEKLLQHWPNAPMGIYSASLGRRCLGEPITYAGIQSIARKVGDMGHVDIVIVDECFVAGTKISTPLGYKDIDIVRCGDTVYNAQGVGVVLGVSAKASQDIYKLEFSDGTITECTGSHPFFTEQGWKQAREMEVGAHFFSIEGLRMLWSIVSTVDKARSGDKENHFGMSRADMEQANLLLSVLCKEVEKPNEQSSGAAKNESQTERDQAQAHQAWRQRAIAAFGSIGAIARPGGWLGSGACNIYKNAASWDRLSNLLQSGFGKPVNEASHRARRNESLQPGEEVTRFEENRFFDFPRLERISRVKPESARTVFNLRVSGHPSYFANGKLVHNCHTINMDQSGTYRRVLAKLTAINPQLRVIGLTASPYRLGQGMIHEGDDALFSALIEPVTIEQLIHLNHLSKLRSKHTAMMLDTTGVKKSGGEFVAGALEAAVDTDANNAAAVQEIMQRGQSRRSWLVFCSGIGHAENINQMLQDHGVASACVTGKTSKTERERILSDYKAGRLRCITNVSVLTTGFDAPMTDLIAFLRPTLSPGLYLQMAGRGLRVADDKDDCLVLDFAGNVERHGPITAIEPPSKARKGDSEARTKTCPVCDELVGLNARTCPSCEHQWPEPEKSSKPLILGNQDILGIEPQEMAVTSWQWRKHTSRTSGKDMLSCTFYGGLSDPAVVCYHCIAHEGYAGDKARRELVTIAYKAGAALPDDDMAEMARLLNISNYPAAIKYKRSGKFFEVKDRIWNV